MARVLVTGGAGFIGSHYVRRAVAQGHEVVLLDDLSRTGSADRLARLRHDLGPGTFAFVQGSVVDARVVDDAVRGCGVVVHLAGQVAVTTSLLDPRHDFEVNALGTLNVLEALRRHAPAAMLVHASTNKVYGPLAHIPVLEEPRRYAMPDHPWGIDEAHPLDPHTPYACSKAAAEQYVRDYARLYGLRTVVFRQSCIYGPGQFGSEDQGWVAWLLRAALTGEPICIFGNGKQVRDLLHVDDLLDAVDAALLRIDQVSGRAFNIGGGPACARSVWHEMGPMLTDLTGREPHVRLAPWRAGDQRVFIADIREATRALDWQPRVPLEEGLRSLTDWLRACLPVWTSADV